MRALARALAALALVLAAGAALALAFGPREVVEGPGAFDAPALPDDLDAWLAAREAAVPDLRPGAEARIVWAGRTGERTPLSIVYLHGFSASPEEIRPVPDLVAEALGANLHFARLTGHGRDGAAMAEATADHWIADVAEALAIGRRIGERVVVIGTSTGGTLAKLAAHDPALSDRLAGIVFVAPNFAINNPAAPLLTLPWARAWLPAVMGEERGFAPRNDEHAAHWTIRYPTVAVLPVAALVAHVRGLDPARAGVPALFLWSEHDRVVSPAAVARVARGWGGPAVLRPVTVGPGDDPSSHVIAGDILSPGMTAAVTGMIVDWASGL
jgi:alpha-beta hydrolase superfamily lysophospholipase